MKLKNSLIAGLALFAASGLASCSQADEPQAPANPYDGPDMVEWNAELQLPDEIKTRAGAALTVGDDGLYAFSRTIDRVWYSVYYNGAYLFDSEQPLTPNVVKKGDAFTVLFKFHKDLDPTKIWIFFWAGNKEDNVTVADATTSNGITLNFQNRCVAVDPRYMNGVASSTTSTLKEFDSFAGYFQLSASKNVTNYNMKVTLTRPFAQIHILSDEFTQPGVSTAFPSGVTVTGGFGKEAATKTNYSTNMMLPNVWFYDSSLSLSPGYQKNEFGYLASNIEFSNGLSGTSPERVTFKSRTMDYLGCMYVFAPVVQAPMKLAASSGDTSVMSHFNLSFRKKGAAVSTAEYADVALPTAGLKANNRYVIYNKENTGDGDGEGGGGGFITDNYAFEISTNNNWTGTNEISM